MMFTVELSGGLELHFGGKRVIQVELDEPATIADLVKHLSNNVMTDRRKEMLVLDDYEVRPGILVLINDTDWELEGKQDYQIQPGDEIMFASTLHGG
ncbi:ubiquitin-related modifier 1 [Lipomyces arxii]|uniref:ubiquitin-related modifier 1 n=1 Tax=Lipomyces arxii TaxID=56418 RepID=UPI0034CF0F0D